MIYNVPIEPVGNDLNDKMIALWGWLVNLLNFDIPFVKTINVKETPIPLGECCVMEHFNNMEFHNQLLKRNTDGKYYIGEKDGKYHIFASD